MCNQYSPAQWFIRREVSFLLITKKNIKGRVMHQERTTNKFFQLIYEWKNCLTNAHIDLVRVHCVHCYLTLRWAGQIWMDTIYSSGIIKRLSHCCHCGNNLPFLYVPNLDHPFTLLEQIIQNNGEFCFKLFMSGLVRLPAWGQPLIWDLSFYLRDIPSGIRSCDL